MKFWIKSAFVILPALLLLGCGTSGEVEEESSADTGEATSTTAITRGIGSGGSASGGKMSDGRQTESMSAESGSGDKVSNEDFFKSDDQMGSSLDDPNSLLATRVIYFDYDKSDVKSEFQQVVQAHAEYLAANSEASVTLEGHADERGTREYNIALGERRTIAVQRLLTLQGASSSQIRVVSYGEERPASLGHNEDAWSLNRRAEIIYNR